MTELDMHKRIAVIDSYPTIFINKDFLNDEWAIKNHNQTIDRLAERGGLSYTEIVANIEKRPLGKISSICEYHALNVVESLAIKSLAIIEKHNDN